LYLDTWIYGIKTIFPNIPIWESCGKRELKISVLYMTSRTHPSREEQDYKRPSPIGSMGRNASAQASHPGLYTRHFQWSLALGIPVWRFKFSKFKIRSINVNLKQKKNSSQMILICTCNLRTTTTGPPPNLIHLIWKVSTHW
jgi:hypothetical protein